MVSILSDGMWHRVEPLIQQMARKVPPGVAVRTVEKQRLRLAPGTERTRPRPLEDQELSGQIFHARDTLRAWVRGGRLELRGEGAEREVRWASREEDDYLTATQLAKVIGRADTTVNSWVRSPQTVAHVSTLMPAENSDVPVVVTDRSGFARFPPKSIVAWQRFSATRRKVGPDGDLLTAAIAEVFNLDYPLARVRMTEIQAVLRRVHSVDDPAEPDGPAGSTTPNDMDVLTP
jgi:hypothetical protein